MLHDVRRIHQAQTVNRRDPAGQRRPRYVANPRQLMMILEDLPKMSTRNIMRRMLRRFERPLASV